MTRRWYALPEMRFNGLLGLLGCWCLGVLLAQGCATGSGNAAPTPEECSDACARIAAANCGDLGSQCFDTCVKQGSAAGSEECPAEVAAYESCFFAAAFFTCSDAGKTQPVGCDSERDVLLACIDGEGTGGAGGASHGGGAASAGEGGELNASGNGGVAG